MSTQHTFFATAASGTEAMLATELAQIGHGAVDPQRGGVFFEGSLRRAMRACLWSRVASRILLPIDRFDAVDAQSLYDGTRQTRWQDHLLKGRTLAITVAGRSDSKDLNNTRFVAQKIKDAIVDTMRDATGQRPSVDLERPDLRIHAHLRGIKVRLSIDLTGESLHRRGIGREGAAAPLKETLASAILMMSGWPELAKQGAPLVDPMCGSATLLIEAAWMALGIAPGLRRPRFGFEGWAGHDHEAWKKLVAEAKHLRNEAARNTVTLIGYDRSKRSIDAARRNVKKAGLGGRITLDVADLDVLTAPPTQDGHSPRGLILTNPPYGARLGESGALGPLYEGLGDTFKRRFPGWRAGVLTGNRALANRVGLKASARHPVFNGPIECRLLIYPLRDEKVVDTEGPIWRKPSQDAEMLVNRLKKNLKQIGKWARKNNVSSYRLYDADIPEYNVAIDLYDGAAHVQEYARPRSVDVHKAERHLRDVTIVLPEVLGIDPKNVALKVRARSPGGKQYDKHDELGEEREVAENGLRFLVNMTDYLDTGLFLDGRIHREMIRDLSAGRQMLNLFAYTCTATVYAAEGGARRTLSVDLSGTYLDWGQRNMALNGFDVPEHRYVKGDVMSWLERATGKFGVIFVAPPTFSKSRRTQETFEVQRDHPRLLRAAARLLPGDGVMIFSNNFRQFQMDASIIRDFDVEEITSKTIPRDFARRGRIHNTWTIRLRTPEAHP